MVSKSDVIISAMRNLGDLVVDGVPASLTGSSLDHLSLIFPLSQQMQGWSAYIYSGAGAGQERIIGSFNATNHRVVFPQVFASIPSVNSNFVISKKFAWSDYKNAVDRFMGIARSKHLVERVATTALVATQYEYPVPSGMEYISTLRLVPTNGTDYAGNDIVDRIFEIPPRFWRTERNVGGSYLVSIDSRKLNLGNVDAYIIRINGQGKPDVLGTDNATVMPALEEYLIAGASAQMCGLLQGSDKRLDPRFYMYRNMVKGEGTSVGLEEYIFSYARGKRVGS